MVAQMGPLLSAVQQALTRPGVRQRTVGGQWRIEFTEEALLEWMIDQNARIRLDVEQALTDPDVDGDKQSPYSAKESAHARSVLRQCLVEVHRSGASDIGVSELLQLMAEQDVDRGRSWVFTNLSRLQEDKLVRHDRALRRWLLLPALANDDKTEVATPR